MEAVLNRRVGGKPLSLWIIAFLAASTAWLASGDTTQCASAASCQTTDNEVFGAGATFNEDRGSAADNDVVVHGDTVDELVDVDASADTTFFNGTVDASAATAIGFSNLVGIEVITTTSTYNVPTGVSTLWVCATAPGGGGGGFNTTTTPNFPGTGGGGGGTACTLIENADPSYTVTIGAVGNGGASDSDGTAGGNTSFGTDAVALGGGGGFFAPGVGGLGGGCSAADVCFVGGDGEAFNSTNSTCFARAAGGSTWRNGSGITANNGIGGSGGCAGSTNGANGGSGNVVVFEYS